MLYFVRRQIACIVVGYCFFSLLPAQQPPQSRTSSRASKKKPLTLENLLHLISLLRPGSDPQLTSKQIVNSIKNNKVDFQCDAPIREQLAKAGATEDIFVAAACPPPPSTPPLPALAAPTSISCNVAECEVFLDGRHMAYTQKGTYRIPERPAQPVEIEVRKDGYKSEMKKIALEPGKEAKVAFSLQPTDATRQQWGTQHFLAALEAFGGPTAIAETSVMEVHGTAAITKGSQKNSWEFNAVMTLPDTVSAEFKLQSATCKVNLALSTPVDCFEMKKKKKQPVEAPADLLTLVQRLQSSHLVSVLGKVLDEKPELTAESSQIVQDVPAILAVHPNSKYSVVLADNHFPKTITYQGSQADDVAEYDYSEVKEFGKAQYPYRTVVKIGPDKATTFEFVFDSIKKPKLQ